MARRSVGELAGTTSATSAAARSSAASAAARVAADAECTAGAECTADTTQPVWCAVHVTDAEYPS